MLPIAVEVLALLEMAVLEGDGVSVRGPGVVVMVKVEVGVGVDVEVGRVKPVGEASDVEEATRALPG
jgi:hypothetical protein